jgi:ketosteroid isomerase-like protein
MNAPADGLQSGTDKTPRSLFERLISGITERRWDELAPLYAHDAVVEMPFAPPPMPKQLVGREAINAHFRHGAEIPVELTPRNTVVHETADPEVVVAEFEYLCRATETDRTFTVANIQVLRVRDGLIQATRDYHDHFGLSQAADQLTGGGSQP